MSSPTTLINERLLVRAMSPRYRIGDWLVDASSGLLTRGEKIVRLSPRGMAVLTHLAGHAPEVVSVESLLDAHWPHTVRSPNVVHKVITELRHALGNGDAAESAYIETIPKRGYRLLVAVDAIAPTGEPDSSCVVDATEGVVRASQRAAGGTSRARAIGAVSMLAIVLGMLGIALMMERSRAPDPSVAADAAPAKSLAVIRFRNIDADPVYDYLAEGIAGALLSSLSRASGLAVVDRERAFLHSLEGTTVTTVGRALSAEYVLDGTVQQLDDRMRVSVTLYRSRDGERLYSYDREEPLTRILRLQERVVGDVLAELDVKLDDTQVAAMHDWGTRNVNAYLAALEGSSAAMRVDQRSMRLAAARMRQAIALDPGFVNGYVALAGILGNMALLSRDAAFIESVRQEVATLRERVRDIDPNHPSLDSLAFLDIQMEGDTLREAEAAARAAIQRLGPPKAANRIYIDYADILKSGHLFTEMEGYVDLYASFEPDDPMVGLRRQVLAQVLLGPDRALPLFRANLLHMPNNVVSMNGFILVLAWDGQFGEAERVLARLRDADEEGLWTWAAEVRLKVIRGELRAGSIELQQALDDPRMGAFTRGIVYFMLGDVPNGIAAWRSIDRGLARIANRWTVDQETHFAPGVVDDPRYQAHLDARGLGAEWTAFLRKKVAELAPITGVAPARAAPQKVRSHCIEWMARSDRPISDVCRRPEN